MRVDALSVNVRASQVDEPTRVRRSDVGVGKHRRRANVRRSSSEMHLVPPAQLRVRTALKASFDCLAWAVALTAAVLLRGDVGPRTIGAALTMLITAAVLTQLCVG